MTETDNTTPAAETPATPVPKKKTVAGKIIQDIEAPAIWVGRELGQLGKLFASQEPAIQDVLKSASQWVQTIKTNVNENPVVVSYLLRKIDPNFTDVQLNDMLTKVANALNITITVVQPTLTDTISALQAHALQLEAGSPAHNAFWTSMFNILGMIVAPGTPWGKIVSIGVYIYNQFIKPKA